MPPPVEFTIRAASLPPGFKGDPQALLSAFAERLLITPSEPWSSFVNGGAQPSSNVGPFLHNGVEWRVWSDGLGTYTFQTLNGAGLILASVTREAMQDGTPNSVFIYGPDGRPQMVSGLPGQVLTAGADLKPVFAPPASGVFFSMQLSADFQYSSDGANHQIPFDLIYVAVNVVPDIVNFRIPVTAGSVWVFGASLQIENTNGGASTDVQHAINIRPLQLDSNAFGSFNLTKVAQSRQGINTMGLYPFNFINDTWVDVAISTVEAVGPSNNFAVSNNGINTRFFGWRLI